ncbi:VOC family protein [Tsukamurella pseudospumae]|uniref:Extradiol ring-cleavage dioxygenase n=1 Tax=Tsukamurella pseudospumae TaxID=239498 RepID=A0A138AU71_9ACTN|nr:VOC family protein [Tsukamurella pseudospumae]KXO98974.1 extradiol ring-cleavage dioxygenase [Tsukamurella pseudospumae]KXP14007.1 extradiol ring-cleavage dioxygenase [Tsukamurella pseudospumae]
MNPPIARIRALRSVELRVPTVTDSTDFYENVWGLKVVERDGAQAWLRGTGMQHHVLQLSDAPQNGLGRISFAVATPAEVDEAARRLESRGIGPIAGPGPLEQVGGGYGLRFADPEGRVVEISADTYAVTKIETGDAVPVGVTHVVLNTVDIDAAVAFYTDVLGMRVSDWSEHQMAFLRCNADHHSIAFNQAEWTAVNHIAYQMPTVDHFMRGIGRLRHHGITPLWGPGKHGPGDNTFSYFADPAGLVCEYTSGIAQVDEDAWLCRVWRRVPELSDLWGTAGPPSKQVRSHMAGVPDPGPARPAAVGAAVSS